MNYLEDGYSKESHRCIDVQGSLSLKVPEQFQINQILFRPIFFVYSFSLANLRLRIDASEEKKLLLFQQFPTPIRTIVDEIFYSSFFCPSLSDYVLIKLRFIIIIVVVIIVFVCLSFSSVFLEET